MSALLEFNYAEHSPGCSDFPSTTVRTSSMQNKGTQVFEESTIQMRKCSKIINLVDYQLQMPRNLTRILNLLTLNAIRETLAMMANRIMPALLNSATVQYSHGFQEVVNYLARLLLSNI